MDDVEQAEAPERRKISRRRSQCRAGAANPHVSRRTHVPGRVHRAVRVATARAPRALVLLTAGVLSSAPLSAQSPAAVCWRGRPKARCTVIVLTNAGGYFMMGGVAANGLRGVADWGAVVNVTDRDAVGASFFVSYDDADGAQVGPAVRYRRWMDRNRSIDFALGTPVTDGKHGLAGFSPYGLVRWNLNDWVGVAVRPELRRPGRDGPAVFTRPPSRFHVSLGMELGWAPGALLTVVGGIGTFVGAVAASLGD